MPSRPSLIKYLLPIICMWAMARVGHAQNLATRAYNVLDGLPSSSVFDIDQNVDGRLCFATRSGVSLFDGYNWQLQTIPGSRAGERMQLCTDADGALLAIQHSGPHQVFQLQGFHWSALTTPVQTFRGPGNVTTFAASGADGNQQLVMSTNLGEIWLWSAGRWHAIQGPDELTPSFLLEAGGVFYIIYPDQIWVLDPRYPESLKSLDNLPATPIYGASQPPNSSTITLIGGTWRGSINDGAFRLDDDAFNGPEGEHATGTSCADDGFGGVYFGNRAGLKYYGPERDVPNLPQGNQLVAKGIARIFIDRENLVWVASHLGVIKILGRGAIGYDPPNRFGDREVSAATSLLDGTMVLAQGHTFTVMWDLPREFVIPDVNMTQRILAMCVDPTGDLWIAVNGNGLFRLDSESQELRKVTIPSTDPLAGCDFVGLDNQGSLLAISGPTVSRRVAGVWQVIPSPALPKGGYLRSVTQLRDGRLMVTADNYGVVQIDTTELHQWQSSLGGWANNACSLLELKQGGIWVGTKGGLFKMAPSGGLELVTFNGRTIRNPIYSITEGTQGSIWIGTDNGVYRWNGTHLRHLTVHDGILGSETNRGAAHWDSSGLFWIGTDSGVTVIDPVKTATKRFKPTTAFMPIDANGDVFELKPGLKLSHQQSTISFTFKTISFVGERRVKHRTWLEGFDDDWTTPAILPARQLRYTNLPSGSYRMHVEAIDTMGQASGPLVSPWFTIKPPFWGTYWFIGGVGISAMLLLAGFVVLIQQRHMSAHLEVEVEQRTAALVTQRNRLEGILANIADGLIVVDQDGRIALWNHAAVAITGRSTDQVIGQTLEPLFGESALLIESKPTGTLAFNGADGEAREIEYSSKAIESQSDHGSLIIAFRDITEKKRIENDLARAKHLESLGILAGGIAHDFNNLLTVVLGNLTLMEQKGALADEANPEALSISKAVNHARVLTRQLMTFSRGGEPIRRVVNLAPLIEKSAELALVGSNTTAKLVLAPDLSAVEVDAGQIAQVLHNLILNARQAQDDKGQVLVTAENAPGGIVTVCIEDKGIGMRPDTLERIFEPYFTTKGTGTGLGLATSHSIIARHNGKLDAVSNIGKGSRFTFTLPASASQSSEPLPPKADRHGANLPILVMDDEAPIRNVLVSILEQLGYATVTCENGEEAIELYTEAQEKGTPFGLLLLDLTIPGGLGGLETLQAIQRGAPAVKAVAMSGFSTVPVMADHADYGFGACLPKPFGVQEVRAVLSDLLQP